jgi:hypothetical protein
VEQFRTRRTRIFTGTAITSTAILTFMKLQGHRMMTPRMDTLKTRRRWERSIESPDVCGPTD